MTNQELKDVFGRNLSVIKLQLDGLTHDDSLLQLPFRGNCLNWVLGHIVDSRDSVLKWLDQELSMSEEEHAIYTFGSEPITDGSKTMHYDTLLARLDASQERIVHGLDKVSEETMNSIAFEKDQITVRGSISFSAWHETYHVGQLEYLRQLAGKNDSVI